MVCGVIFIYEKSSINNNIKDITMNVNRDSTIDIAMGYGLDGRGSIPGRGRDFLYSTASRPSLEPTQPPIQRGTGGSFPGSKAAGA
jgi:hypothetical protein